jgi:mono/diheme cytochrome c family protein
MENASAPSSFRSSVIGKTACELNFVKILIALLVASSAGLIAQTSQISNSRADFQREVRPIFSDNCFRCHGPDQSTRMADLRLDTKEGAFGNRKNGTPIIPGKPEESLVYQRITASTADQRMPPSYAHKTLTAQQIEIIHRWIREDATWKEHWAFITPARPELPAVDAREWGRNPIDRFILARLEREGLQPAAEADRRTLIRRLSLDLTGLPPQPQEIDAFVQDNSQDAYEKVVDRLLASPHYGEHRARYWLDAARYADTHGLHDDNYREMWPYRDWVIRAFNRNLSFDRFTIEQLAGDLLPNSTLDQQIASGFQRCNVSTSEGGAILEEVAAMYAKDRADTTGTVWLGLTVGCATCHDHKFDPITQREYYSLTAFFRNLNEFPLDGNVPNTPPSVIVPRAEDQERWEEINRHRASMRQSLVEAKRNRSDAFAAWLESPDRRSLPLPYGAATRVLELTVSNGVSLMRKGRPEAIALPDGVTVSAGVTAPGAALHFGKKAFVTLPNVPDVDADRPFTISTWVYVPREKGSYVIASQFEPEPKEEAKDGRDWRRGWIVEFSNEGPSIKLTGENRAYITAAPVGDRDFPGERWYHVLLTYDGSREREGLAIYVNGRILRTQGTGQDLEPLRSSPRTASPLRLGNDKGKYLEDGAIAEFRIFDREADEREAELLSLWNAISTASPKATTRLTGAEREALQVYYFYQRDTATRATLDHLRSLDAEWRQIARRGATTLVMQERPDAKPAAHVLYRGQYNQLRDEVGPRSPAVLPPMRESFPRNRLGLAEWLVDPANPLTARVTVNRFWQEVFGAGIVKTSEDFGSQGEVPSHPALLDWLAVEFRESGWDVKKLFKLMVTSATYRQSARATEQKLKADPDNRLLSRGPRFRMDGEMVRDYALAASGLLVPAIGGPSVKPYQPKGLWEAVAMDPSNTRFYLQDHGDKLYRRSLYTFWKRSAPPPSMDIFNAPTRESCTVRREHANTPLQALVTMNDPQFFESARTLAQRALLGARGDFDSELDFMTVRLLARPLDGKEREIAKRAYGDYKNYYGAHAEDARQAISVGESKADAGLPAPELAAMTMLASQLMNLDEVLQK